MSKTVSQTEDKTVSLLLEWAAAATAADGPRLAALFTEDAEYEDVAVAHISRGHQEIMDFTKVFSTGFPDMVFTITNVVYDDDANRAAAEWTMAGTHKGDMPGMPPANGGTCNLRGMSFLELRDGKIARASDYWNMAEFLTQLGHMG